MGRKVFDICNFVGVSIGFAASVTLLLIFIGIWIGGDMWVGEDNLIIRSIETAILLFAIPFLGMMMYQTFAKIIGKGNRETTYDKP